ncbi:MAG: hypothetical protein JJ863_04465 [Deltaproteobacteria bacterium]|nr:hypothetical protein [Deltaproteobacteria bacterium]
MARGSSSTILVGSVLVGASLAAGALAMFLMSRSAYRRARLEAILDDPARVFDSSWILQGGALMLLLLGLVGIALIVFGIRDRVSGTQPKS